MRALALTWIRRSRHTTGRSSCVESGGIVLDEPDVRMISRQVYAAHSIRSESRNSDATDPADKRVR